MADLNGAVQLGGDVPILGQAPQHLVAIDLGLTPVVVQGSDGASHGAVAFTFAVDVGKTLPPVVLVLPDDALVALPDVLRKIVQQARRDAERRDAASEDEEE